MAKKRRATRVTHGLVANALEMQTRNDMLRDAHDKKLREQSWLDQETIDGQLHICIYDSDNRCYVVYVEGRLSKKFVIDPKYVIPEDIVDMMHRGLMRQAILRRRGWRRK